MIINEFLNKKPISGEISFYNPQIDLTDKIVVLEFTTPLMAPYLVNAKAIIVERGGILSHTAIFARELDIPAYRIENATKIFKTGQKVEIKENGEVVILK